MWCVGHNVGYNTRRRILRDVAATHIDRMWCVGHDVGYNTSRRIPWDVAATHCCSFYDWVFILLIGWVFPPAVV